MKKLAIISAFSLAIIAVSCNDVQRSPGKVYMPDMAYSRAYETYADHSELKNKGINYINQPVAGTVMRGEELPYHLSNDSSGYAASANIQSPLPKLDDATSAEAERLYLINCAICHGTALDGNGPLYKDGAGPFPAKPATLLGDAKIEALSAGTYYHVMTYGKNLMGSYASQLNRKQRWIIAQYIKDRQQGKNAAAAAPATGTDGMAAPAEGQENASATK
jgi:mono/diheme cytochrome c family protein